MPPALFGGLHDDLGLAELGKLLVDRLFLLEVRLRDAMETKLLRRDIGTKPLWRKKHRPEKFPAGRRIVSNQPRFGHARGPSRPKINIAFTEDSRLNAKSVRNRKGHPKGQGLVR